MTYLSVQLSLISLFLKLDLDFLCAARTAPCHSWRNPAERVMSIVNLGLQCVGLMRGKMSDEHEAAISHCNTLSQLRQAAKNKPELVPAILDSIDSTKILLSDILRRLELQGEKFLIYSAASEDSMKELWSELEAVDPTLEYGGQFRKADLDKFQTLVTFMEHCCQTRHYSFTIKKCGEPSCTLCKPVRAPRESFDVLNFLPDPIPGKDGHYCPFTKVYGTTTTERHRPSLQTCKQKTLPFTASVQHVKNANTMVQCEECEMWRLIYSKYKLTPSERQTLNQALDEYTYTCGGQIAELEFDGRFSQDIVAIRKTQCYEPLEKLYYSVGDYESICIYCCKNKDLSSKENCYPQCSACSKRDPIKKRK